MKVVSIIIRAKNEGKYLQKLLKKIKDQKGDFKIEVILVDSGSTDNTLEIAKEEGCKIIRIKPEEFTWGRALNIGIENSKGEYCVLISAHCFPVDNMWLSNLLKSLIENEKVAASFGGQLPIRDIDPFEEVELKLWFPKDKKGKIGVSDSNACIRREVWKKYRFNEILSSYEDAEWVMRIKNAGYYVTYIPEAAVYHSHKIKVDSIYVRWYWRCRMAVYIRRRENKIKIATKFPPKFVGFAFFIFSYFLWFYRSIIHLMKNRYFRILWYTPFYEIVRMYALYCGIVDGLRDIKQGKNVKEFSYFKISPPTFLRKLRFLENISTEHHIVE